MRFLGRASRRVRWEGACSTQAATFAASATSGFRSARGALRRRRRRRAARLSASEFLRQQLAASGLQDGPRKRVIAEPFSRYIRGVRPAFLDVSAAYLKATLLFAAFDEGQ